MGYDTKYQGTLYFKEELLSSELARLNSMLGEDCRDHPEWGVNGHLTYIDLELNDDFNGIQWNGSEKTYDLDEKINLVINFMKTINSRFGLTGKLLCQGEDVDDRFEIVAQENGYVKHIKLDDVKIQMVICPNCDHRFTND